MENLGPVLGNTGFTSAALASSKLLPMTLLMKLFSFRIFQTLLATAAISCASVLSFATCHAHEFSVGTLFALANKSTGKLAIEHPWARATAPAARTGVVYFSLKNSADQGDTLLGVVVDKSIAQRASLHAMWMDAKGLMHMAEFQAGLAVAAKAEVKFAPGGYHVMLEGLSKPLVAKQEFGMTLQFAKAGSISVIVLVE